MDLALYFSLMRAENFELEAEKTQNPGRNKIPVSKALVGEISTTTRLFVIAKEVYYSSEIRKSSVLFVMVRLLVFISISCIPFAQ